MALSKVSSFPWEKVLAGVEGNKKLLGLRAQANEIVSSFSKYSAPPEPVKFEETRKRLKFATSAVDSLEKLYKSRKLPVYTATLPDFEAKKRAAIIETIHAASVAAELDLSNLQNQLKEFESKKFDKDTTYDVACNRFPSVAKEVDEEVQNHKW
eukprot:CAMPEP_0196765486 /NCGR_PEP_ID=MMETSP1095-20130614/9381_1 /TAXON_ID=96789 ORGANISM="Chromulina nebulosa, Strain UTEXLB2642" /NCGR_SAMPLE_ID=MMETSP1095 /ASSEMBLY_ACC=CAM_ASM_000446 /LENGTH=153 /DNA_ID=CAMNT_0042123613 /DNA_START=18 /DNA_END=476 /DNA_ORIENTATION=-